MEKTFAPYKHIEGVSADVQRYLYSLFVSISNVDSSYIHYDGYNLDKDFEHVERVFAYELYRQWCNYPLINNNKYLVVNAEIPKNLIGDWRREVKDLTYPDLVLHHGQNHYKGNLIICEIKRRSYAQQNPDKTLDDFLKLNTYLSKKLKVKPNNENWEPFKIGVFILTESEESNVPLSVQDIKICLGKKMEEVKEIGDTIMKRIICVVYNGKDLKYDNLFNIINNK